MTSSETVILTKTTSKGQKVEIVLARSNMDAACATAYVDGKCVSAIERCVELAKLYAHAPHLLKQAPAGVTHAIGKVGLTSAEAATVESALSVFQAQIDAEPKVLARKLRSKRDELVSSIRGWDEEAQYSSDKAWERGDEADAFVGKAVTTAQQEAAAARARLAEFDVAHPEIRAVIELELNEAAARRSLD